MLIFAILMLAAAVTMILTQEKFSSKADTEAERQQKVGLLVFLGLFVGVITGLLGAGGGFMIIPALVLFLKLPMQKSSRHFFTYHLHQFIIWVSFQP